MASPSSLRLCGTSGLLTRPLSLQCLAKEHLDLNMSALLWGNTQQPCGWWTQRWKNTLLGIVVMREDKAIQRKLERSGVALGAVVVFIGW